ncbi:MAG: glycosyltransferase [Planctomycetota bacterium]
MTATSIASARVLHLLEHQGVGGVTRSVIELVRHERMDGAGDEIVLVERALDVDADFAAPATPVHFLGIGEPDRKRRAQRLVDLAHSRGARAVHAHCESALDFIGLASGAGLSTVATLHLPPSERSFLGRRRRRSVLRGLDGLFVSNPALVEPWSRFGRRPEVLPLAVDPSRFHPGAEPSSWRVLRAPDPETLLVGSLMRAEEGKRDDVLFDAVEARAAAGRKTALILVGDGPTYEERKARARGSDVLHVRKRVFDVTSWMAMIDVLALHDGSELTPMALLEGLACARPVVVADRGPVAALVGDEAATFVPPGDVQAVVAALDALADADRRVELGRQGRERILAHHALADVRRALGPLYA